MKIKFHGALFAALFMAAASCFAQMRLPLMRNAPVIDGKIDPAEWQGSDSFEGLQSGDVLQRRRAQVYIGATETHFFIAIRSQLPAKGVLQANAKNPAGLADDDTADIYINPVPDARDSVTYQILFNSAGLSMWDFHCAGKAWERTEWKGDWQVAGTIQDGWWEAECSIPITGMRGVAPGRKTIDGTWRINVARDWKNSDASSALTSGPFAAGGYAFSVDPGAPAIHYTCEADPFMGNCKGTLSVYNPTNNEIEVSGSAKLEASGIAPPFARDTPVSVKIKPGGSFQTSVPIPALKKATSYALSIALAFKGATSPWYVRQVSWPASKQAYVWDATTEGAASLLLPVAPAPGEALFGARMQRTMSLLATSNSSRRNHVHIVIYGQSITESPWWHLLEKQLRDQFPKADLVIENRSIGGLGADIMARMAIHQVHPLYPDLVIFHSYTENPNDYERVIADLRRYTTADILLFTHHMMDLPKELDKPWETLGLTRIQDDSSNDLRLLAQKYSCELVEVRDEWKQYLHDQNLRPMQLLNPDGVHMNPHGRELLAYLVGRHFRYTTLFPDPWFSRVRRYDMRRPLVEAMNDEVTYPDGDWTPDHDTMVGSSAKSPARLTFEGNRVDILGGTLRDKKTELGTARILIDGRPGSEHPECYAFTLPSHAPGTVMPGLLRVMHHSPLILEDWTLRVTSLNDDASEFSYEVAGSVTGPDGTGNNKSPFVSNSGRVVIEPQDLYRITWGHKNTDKRCYPGFEVTWKVVPLFKDIYTPPAITDPHLVSAVTVVQGLANAQHTLEIIPNGDGPVLIDAIQAYKPPLK